MNYRHALGLTVAILPPSAVALTSAGAAFAAIASDADTAFVFSLLLYSLAIITCFMSSALSMVVWAYQGNTGPSKMFRVGAVIGPLCALFLAFTGYFAVAYLNGQMKRDQDRAVYSRH